MPPLAEKMHELLPQSGCAEFIASPSHSGTPQSTDYRARRFRSRRCLYPRADTARYHRPRCVRPPIGTRRSGGSVRRCMMGRSFLRLRFLGWCFSCLRRLSASCQAQSDNHGRALAFTASRGCVRCRYARSSLFRLMLRVSSPRYLAGGQGCAFILSHYITPGLLRIELSMISSGTSPCSSGM